MDIVLAALPLALIYQAVNLVRFAKAKALSEVVTVVAAGLVGVGAAFLIAASDFASAITWNEVTLEGLNGAGLTLVGLAWAAGAGVVNDVFGALDNNRNTSKPTLIDE